MSRWLLRNQKKLTDDRMADALLSGRSRDFWGDVKKKKGLTRDSTKMIDDAIGDEYVCNLFKDKYESTPYILVFHLMMLNCHNC